MPLFMIRSFAFAAIIMACICPVHGETRTPVEAELNVETVLVAAPFMSGKGPVRAEPVLGELSLMGTAQTILGNGVRLRGRFAGHAQYDHPDRPGGIGGFGSKTDLLQTGRFSGFSSALPFGKPGVRARIETFYGQIDGGYGEIRFGKDKGVAARFYEGAPSAINHTRLDSPLLDIGGLGTIRTRHDLTGQSFKLSYASPRLLGVRAGITLTPDASSADGLDRRPAANPADFSARPHNAVEAALNVRRVLRKSRLRFDAALAWSRARIKTRTQAQMGTYVETRSAGIQFARGNWSLGAAWLASNNGVPDGDYRAWSSGIGYKSDQDIHLSFQYGEANDKAAGFKSYGWQSAISSHVNDQVRLGAACFHQTVNTGAGQWTSQGLFVTVVFSGTILNITGN